MYHQFCNFLIIFLFLIFKKLINEHSKEFNPEQASGWRLVPLSQTLLLSQEAGAFYISPEIFSADYMCIFVSSVIWRFYKLLLHSSWFTFFPVMILPRVAIHAPVITLTGVFMNILFIYIDLSLTPLQLFISMASTVNLERCQRWLSEKKWLSEARYIAPLERHKPRCYQFLTILRWGARQGWYKPPSVSRAAAGGHIFPHGGDVRMSTFSLLILCRETCGSWEW